MPTAVEQIHSLIRRDIESGTKNYAVSHGYDWFNLTAAEAEVFELELHDLPSLVAVWCAYEAVLAVCDMMPISEELRAQFLTEQPWLADSQKGAIVDAVEFQRFAKLFGVSYRKAAAWYAKNNFWLTRTGITYFADEKKGTAVAVASHAAFADDDIPF